METIQVDNKTLPILTRKYCIIYADPGWAYNDKAQAGQRGAGFKYTVMTAVEIAALSVASIAAKDSVLFLWATCPMLPEALEVMSAWGFEYKTVAFTWVKRTRTHLKLHWGMGNWTRANSELCLLGIRGRPKRLSAAVHQIIDSPVREHSRKPEEARTRIVRLMGNLPRIELFAREEAPGWDCWGDEVDGATILEP